MKKMKINNTLTNLFKSIKHNKRENIMSITKNNTTDQLVPLRTTERRINGDIPIQQQTPFNPNNYTKPTMFAEKAKPEEEESNNVELDGVKDAISKITSFAKEFADNVIMKKDMSTLLQSIPFIRETAIYRHNDVVIVCNNFNIIVSTSKGDLALFSSESVLSFVLRLNMMVNDESIVQSFTEALEYIAIETMDKHNRFN